MTGLVSQLATQSQIESPVYRYWCGEMRKPPLYIKKYWESVFILQALKENDMLRTGRRGLGFGVGKEALPAIIL